jgi:hypothetical protein
VDYHASVGGEYSIAAIALYGRVQVDHFMLEMITDKLANKSWYQTLLRTKRACTYVFEIIWAIEISVTFSTHILFQILLVTRGVLVMLLPRPSAGKRPLTGAAVQAI